jgi:hypothetical protein
MRSARQFSFIIQRAVLFRRHRSPLDLESLRSLATPMNPLIPKPQNTKPMECLARGVRAVTTVATVAVSNNDIVVVGIKFLSPNIPAVVAAIGEILRVGGEVREGGLNKIRVLKYCQHSSIERNASRRGECLHRCKGTCMLGGAGRC